ncbi:type VI secretion system baseplate subunit TssF [Xanthobacter oligotrophicus]|uniref:type VI secretion system baseplate subunit TssF n=1 Tax=Xanthobacter oligotrophicus TaxID=2607286 RepID=UPI0011F16C2B|nr:type VI secretion system baseplate subunit TssF [Xanthobacter oligotrophicus]MCG5233961.1 type VI secretion system baseplate subunit TssF [Xanthobacter oligotrophicus]
MDREFLEQYDQELRLLKEQAREFAEEYPGIADRLGGLINDPSDPAILGLLQGAAFLAARVQLKLNHEFPEFTSNLLEQLVPGFLAPHPSAMIVAVDPLYGDPALTEGRRINAGAYLDATFVERDRRIACRYALRSDITLWPLELVGAEYHAATGPLHALGLPAVTGDRAGLRLSFTTRMAARPEDEVSDADASRKPPFHAAACRLRDLPVYLAGAEGDAAALYEQMFAHRRRVFVRYLDAFGDPVVIEAEAASLTQLGLGDHETLAPSDNRVFHGFSLLKDYFLFPRKYLSFRLERIDRVISRINAKSFDIFILFSESSLRLAAAVSREMFCLYAAPAINLFEKTTDRIPVKSNQHEYQVVPDRSRPLDLEPHRLLDVFAYFPGHADKVPVLPLYSAPRDPSAPAGKLFYTIRRLPRRRSSQERRHGRASDYTGTEMFLSLIDTGDLDQDPGVFELSLKALCSNRHLTESLPVGTGGADFQLLEDVRLPLRCVAGPTPPSEPVASYMRLRSETASTGSVTWRLINMLSLNHLGLLDRGAGHNAQSLREILALFASLRDPTVERRIDGVRALDSRPVVRRVRRETGVGVARGLEILVTLDEKAFEGSGAFLLGAVLDRFFAEYVSVNTFTQTVIVSVERGEIMRWPVRLGYRRPL